MRQIDGTLYMSLFVKRLATYIKEHEILSIVGNGVVNTPAVDFKLKQTFYFYPLPQIPPARGGKKIPGT